MSGAGPLATDTKTQYLADLDRAYYVPPEGVGKTEIMACAEEVWDDAFAAGIVAGLIRAAVHLESAAKSQELAAWESAQRRGMEDFVKAHEATAKAYRAGAESLREQAKWAAET